MRVPPPARRYEVGIHLLFGWMTAAVLPLAGRVVIENRHPGRFALARRYRKSRPRLQESGDIEPLVARAAAGIEDRKTGLAGWLPICLLVDPNFPPFIDASDDQSFAALEEAVRRHGVAYELVTDKSGGTLWLVPPH